MSESPARADDLAGLILGAIQQDADAITALFGDTKLSTLAAVGARFGVQLKTVKDWRRDGMPGEPGAFPLGAIFLWKLKRVISAPQFTTAISGDAKNDLDRKRAADARRSEVDALEKERKHELNKGTLLPRGDVERELAGMLIMIRESILRTPREMTPRFPRALAVDLTEELRTLLEGKLRVMSNRRASWEPPATDETAAPA